MNRKHLLVSAILLTLLLSYCKKPGCLENAGAVVTASRNANPFDSIDLYDNVNLILTQDTVESIRIKAPERILPNISTQVTNGTLTIRNNTSCNWLRNPDEKIDVFVTVKDLKYINYRGSGNISSTNTIMGDKITFYSDKGSGNINVRLNVRRADAIIEYENADFTLTGRADYCYTYTNSRGSIYLQDLQVQYMVIAYASVRNTVVNVSDVIEATIFHTGNIYYKGNPTIAANNSYSSGRLYPAQ